MKSDLIEYPTLQGFFDFPQFNPIQKKCLPKIMKTDNNMIVSAPTSSGKTALFQMAILKYRSLSNPICLYLAPIKSLCHEKYLDWKNKFSNILTVSQVTGDSVQTGNDNFLSAHIAVGTPQKVDFLSRQNLTYLKKIRLLLIDQIHMLNYEERGATLEAIVSRIMSLNKEVRIIAVSATIPNINQVGEWLKCPSQSVCVFGEEYRPVKLNLVVNGYPSTANPFTFERNLNFKLLELVRIYSQKKGTLIFCPTQKGTQQACEQIISQMSEREFIQNDRQLVSLIQAAKVVSNSKLQTMIPQGVAFHNASLSYQDRNLVQNLFLDLKIKVLCTTSTLSMGINLPARLVIVKSTQCYRGSMKGYQQYTRIQIEQMMGRAGRPPFDTQGTVVIMTQKANYNRYNSKLQLENLQSQLFNHMLEHINAQISLGSITSLQDLESYFFNSFCFIRMKQAPKNYGIIGNVQNFIKSNCLKAVHKLVDLKIIVFHEQHLKVAPKPLSISISKNAVEIRSIALVTEQSNNIESSKQYLQTLCKCEEIGKYTSKLEERKNLKEINEKNKFPIKEAISNPERKSFVLAQAELSQIYIEYWEMRRQGSQIIVLLKRLNNCVKVLAFELKCFWLYYWSVRYMKYFTLRFWQFSQKQMMLQFHSLDEQTRSTFMNSKAMKNLPQALQMNHWLKKADSGQQAKQLELFQNGIRIQIEKDESSKVIVKITMMDGLKQPFKGATICVGDPSNYLYHHKYLNSNNRQVSIHFPNNSQQQYKIGIIKDGIVGFDQFYKLKGSTLFKFDIEQQDLKPNNNRKSLEHKNQPESSMENIKSHSLSNNKQVPKKNKKTQPDQTIQKKVLANCQKNSPFNTDYEDTNPLRKSSHVILPPKYRRKINQSPEIIEDSHFQKKINRESSSGFKDLKNDYKWKPGFEEIISSESSKQKSKKELKMVESKQKSEQFSFKQFEFRNNIPKRVNQTQRSNRWTNPPKQQQKKQQEDVFSYFYNLF